MDFLYLMINGPDWEDNIIFTMKEDAIKSSIESPNSRVEIFIKNPITNEYSPTYNYYKNGIYYISS